MKQQTYCAYFQGEARLHGQRNVIAEVGSKWVYITKQGAKQRRKISRKIWDAQLAPTAKLIEEKV